MKKVFSFLLLILVFTNLNAQVVNDGQLLKSDFWIYQDLETLSLESKEVLFWDTTPVSVGEIKFYLKQLDYEKLSQNGKDLYNKVYDYLYTTSYIGKKNLQSQGIEKDSATRFSVGIDFNPEVYFRTNKDIQSSVQYYYENWPLSAPIKFGVSDYVCLELDFFLGKNYYSSTSTDSFTNIPLSGGDIEYEFPRFAYGSFGKTYEDWGYNFTIGKEGFSIGNTTLGSIIYNSTFETDAYSVASVYSPKFKYNLIFSQVTHKSFLYLHNFNVKILPNLKFSITEGGLREGPIELKYFNPTMIIHSFYGADIYKTEEKYNLNRHYSSYLGFTLDYNPVKNLRLYFLYAMTEMQLPGERNSSYGSLLPNGIGLQGGIDFSRPSGSEGFYVGNIEAVYTCPYLYLKQSPDWSLVKLRFDKMNASNPVVSWIGSPFGPDTFALTLSFGYTQPQKWSAKAGYLLTMKGEIDGKTIQEKLPLKSEKDNPDAEKYPAYYPTVLHELGYLTEEEARERAQVQGLSGIIQYRNDVSISGEYWFSKKLKANAEGIYTFVFNNNHKKNDFQQGFELKLSCSYNIF